MSLHSLSLQNFRSYTTSVFSFKNKTTIIIGKNAAGKSNLIESIFLLATGKSNRSEREGQLIRFGESVCRIKGEVGADTEETNEPEVVEIVVSQVPEQAARKRYLVNGVPRRRVDFAGKLTAVLFTPEDLDLVTGQPSSRRRFLDEVLEQVDAGYRLAHETYTRALRQRNALLEQVQETGARDQQLFQYWDDLLIRNGTILTQKREALIEWINQRTKELFSFILVYDKSVISEERLLQYKTAEVGAGVTLVGPHRDDVFIHGHHAVATELVDLKHFASRGQQRLVTLELKLAQIAFLEKETKTQPLLLLDDIFSELDTNHIQQVLHFVDTHQTIITTTHKEFVENVVGDMIELKIERSI